MVADTDQDDPRPQPPALKVIEPRVNLVAPWTDDQLDRQKIAERLTAIVQDQQAPFVISLDGRWGTGKTFLLKRWRQELINTKYQAIYFNAWEDDFYDDPLLAIIGQLSEQFKEGRFRDLAIKIASLVLGLITKQLTGTAMDVRDLAPESFVDEYHEHLRTKQEMKEQISALADQVRQETGKPLVFIIDELDRCRPTFAIELLERVKHIFDVHHIVFVFGINRAELVKSLESLYGKIDAGVYLRRFFDMEFTLPDADAKEFCQVLVQAYGLDTFSTEMSDRTRNSTYWNEFRSVASALTLIVEHIGLSLRDIDYCARLISMAARGGQPYAMGLPSLFVLLVAVKISDPTLYQRVVHGNGRGAELVDFMTEKHASQGSHAPETGSRDWNNLTMLEAAVYAADDGRVSLNQLQQITSQAEPSLPQYLTKETATLQVGIESHALRLKRLIESLERFIKDWDWEPLSFASMARSIELTSEIVRR